MWAMKDGTDLKGPFTLKKGDVIDAASQQQPISDEVYYIVPDKCTECEGFHEEPQCAAVCPVDCCIPDELNVDSHDELMARKLKLHL